MRDKLGVILVSLAVVLCTSIGYGQEMKVSERTLPVDQDQNRDPNEVYLAVQIKAEPYGGMAAFHREFKSNFIMPKEVFDKKSYLVILQFTVERDGSLTDIKIMRSPGYGLGEEAVRVLSEVTKWCPAIQNKLPVRSRFTIPITLKVDEFLYQRITYKNGEGKVYNDLPIPAMDVNEYCKRFIKVFKKSQYYEKGIAYSLRIKLSIGEQGNVVAMVLYKDSMGLERSVDELIDVVNSISKWLPNRVDNVPIAEDVILQISIDPSEK